MKKKILMLGILVSICGVSYSVPQLTKSQEKQVKSNAVGEEAEAINNGYSTCISKCYNQYPVNTETSNPTPTDIANAPKLYACKYACLEKEMKAKKSKTLLKYYQTIAASQMLDQTAQKVANKGVSNTTIY